MVTTAMIRSLSFNCLSVFQMCGVLFRTLATKPLPTPCFQGPCQLLDRHTLEAGYGNFVARSQCLHDGHHRADTLLRKTIIPASWIFQTERALIHKFP